MTPFARRAAILVVAVAGAALALRLPRLKLPTRAPAQRLGLERWHASDTLGRGESLASLLGRRGLNTTDAAAAIGALDGLLDDRRIPAGMEVEVHGDSSSRRPTDVVLLLNQDKILRLRRNGDAWSAREELIPWVTDTLVVRGVVRSTLYDALEAGASPYLSKGARSELAWELADIYEYRVDMSRELQDGDSVRVLFERSTNPSNLHRIGRILAAGLERGGNEVTAIRFVHADGKAEYFDAAGKSLRASFLRAPVSFRRISSVFGRRKHPVLGIWRAHKGTDYAAPSGTPVRAIGDGSVIFAGHKGGYGNVLEIRYRNGFVSRYGHLKGFAAGIRVGRAVAQGETVAYVGTTGLSTGPHLHFELLVKGVQRDPRYALRASAAVALAGKERAAFDAVGRVALAQLDRAAGPLRQP
ncbi:MAG: M23 family metallopeptidase [Gemmatimonadota bacterium]|nr:M23 family metallopeptidase [Gemmatimonadota bacterium]